MSCRAPNPDNPRCECGNIMAKNGGIKRWSKFYTAYFVCNNCMVRYAIRYTFDGMEESRSITGEFKHAPKRVPARSKGAPAMQPTLCWGCRNAYADKCSYHSRRHTPVDGWKVEASELYGERTHTVIECPNYDPDRRKA